MLAKALQTEIIFKTRITVKEPDMDRLSEAHTNASCLGAPNEKDHPMLRQAKESLLQAKEALRLAQEAYDVLASLHPPKIITSRRKQLIRRKSSTSEYAHAQRQKNELSAAKASLRIQGRARAPSFYKGFQPDIRIEQPVEELPALFERAKSLDQFARDLGVTRRNAIHALKTAGIDVFEAIAKDWENGQSLRVLSEKHGPTPQTISNWIKSTGREIKPRNSNEKYDRARVYELFDDGCTTNYIATTLELSWATVQKCKGDWWVSKARQA